ncbi:MAG TPA: histidine kinase [Chitinophagaceae bacterium]|nr:histidine kinase [Chitinophagaceae bacterium]
MFKNAVWIAVLCLWCLHAWTQSTEPDYNTYMRNGQEHLAHFRALEAMQQFNGAIRIALLNDKNNQLAQALIGESQATWYAGNFHQAADTMKLALKYLTDGQVQDKISGWRILSNIYDDIGDYVAAFKAVQQALAMNKGLDRQNELLSLVQVGKLYKNIGDYETAMEYYSKVLGRMPKKGSYPYRELHHCLGDLCVAKGALDSAYFYYRQAFTGFRNSPVIRLRLGELHLRENHLDSASWYLDSLYKDVIVSNDVNIGIGVTIGLAKVALARGKLSTAFSLAQKAFDVALQKGIYKYRMDAAALLGRLHEQKGEMAKALHYQKLYHSMKDSSLSDVYKGQLYAFKQRTTQSQLAALEADKKLAQRTILVVGLVAVLVIAILIFRHKNEKLRLKQKTTEMEMQALLAQMNPHFIFNCLSAINHSILNKEPDKASEYLTRFSRLVRMVLMNANKKSISLEEELDMLRLYLDMEQLRFKNAFDYTIQLERGLQTSQLQVPVFILQPFCENAIWHGLLHKEGKGHLLIDLHTKDGQLIVSIQDDGIGLAEAAVRKTKNTEPMGLQLTAMRLALFNQSKYAGQHFTLRELKDRQGTEAIITISTRLSYD